MVVFSCGMGVDSVTALVRHLREPMTRDYPLKELVVLIAQTGDEFPDTQALVEDYLFPLLRQYQVRTIQVARAGATQDAGIAVLDDTSQPRTCFIKGAYSLHDELLTAGTVPQYASGRRQCSVKAKGWVLDTLIERLTESQPFRHIMGFNADEQGRADRDSGYSNHVRSSEYPLIEWGWGREACELYLFQQFGVVWQKSCCGYCPFAGGREPMMLRYRTFPAQAGFAAYLEFVSLALNPRMTLYARKGTLLDALRRDGNEAALRNFEARLGATTWGLYQVRRVYFRGGRADRSVVRHHEGEREAMQQMLHRLANGNLVTEGGHPRVYVHQREEGVYPTFEEMWVACPAVVVDKERKRFKTVWAKALGLVPQQLKLL